MYAGKNVGDLASWNLASQLTHQRKPQFQRLIRSTTHIESIEKHHVRFVADSNPEARILFCPARRLSSARFTRFVASEDRSSEAPWFKSDTTVNKDLSSFISVNRCTRSSPTRLWILARYCGVLKEAASWILSCTHWCSRQFVVESRIALGSSQARDNVAHNGVKNCRYGESLGLDIGPVVSKWQCSLFSVLRRSPSLPNPPKPPHPWMPPQPKVFIMS